MTGCGHAGTVAAHQTGNTAMRARLRSAVEGNVRTLRSRSRACPLQMAEAGYTTVMMGRDRVGLPHAPTRSVCRANDWFANPVSGVTSGLLPAPSYRALRSLHQLPQEFVWTLTQKQEVVFVRQGSHHRGFHGDTTLEHRRITFMAACASDD